LRWSLSSFVYHTTIFIGGAIKGLVDMKKKKENISSTEEEDELGKGSLFATEDLVQEVLLAGVYYCIFSFPQ
jgi:hypothetical protein